MIRKYTLDVTFYIRWYAWGSLSRAEPMYLYTGIGLFKSVNNDDLIW